MLGWIQHATEQAGNSSGVDCKWLLVGACGPMAAVILGLWRALEKANAGRLEDLKKNYKIVKEEKEEKDD